MISVLRACPALLLTLVACSNCGTNPQGPPSPPPSPPSALGGMPGAPVGAGGMAPLPDPWAAGTTGFAGMPTTEVAGASNAIEWTVCADSARKVSPQEIARLRQTLMPVRPKQLRAHVRASYEIVEGLPDRFWLGYTTALDQNHPPDGGPGLGSCTGNAATQWRVNEPWAWGGTLNPATLERFAISVYGDGTHIDPFEGAYPPDDTGSDGPSVMQVLKSRGLVSDWHSVYTFAGLQRELQRGPCIMGSNWYTGMFQGDRCGSIKPTGVVEGGHETLLAGIRYTTKQVVGRNSWDNGWGVKTRLGLGGYFWLTFGDIQRLINEGADFVCGTAAGTGERL